jgi:hypothetical protein
MVFKCFFHVFSDICSKCFISLLLYVASIESGCFKNRVFVYGMNREGREQSPHEHTARARVACKMQARPGDARAV